MGHVAWQLFDWPTGILVGNLLASLVWSCLFEWRLRVHRKKTKADQKEHERLLRKILDKIDGDPET